jgi:hypothetical protein
VSQQQPTAPRTIALSTSQRAQVLAAANGLPIEKRNTFMQRVEARIRQRGGSARRADDADVDIAIRTALVSLLHTAA